MRAARGAGSHHGPQRRHAQGRRLGGRVSLPFLEATPPPPGAYRLTLLPETDSWLVWTIDALEGELKVEMRQHGYEGCLKALLVFSGLVRPAGQALSYKTHPAGARRDAPCVGPSWPRWRSWPGLHGPCGLPPRAGARATGRTAGGSSSLPSTRTRATSSQSGWTTTTARAPTTLCWWTMGARTTRRCPSGTRSESRGSPTCANASSTCGCTATCCRATTRRGCSPLTSTSLSSPRTPT